MRDDLYSEGREAIVDSEQAEEEDDISEIEEEVESEESPSFSLASTCSRENTGGRGTATEARRRS